MQHDRQPTSTTSKSRNNNPSRGTSLGVMMSILGVAILIAALIAYRMIYPFFHLHPH
jgi:multisubunit Na+/H+ antiporter MnhG subunit